MPQSLLGAFLCITSLVTGSEATAQTCARMTSHATRAEIATMAATCARQATDPARPASERAQSSSEEHNLRERLTVGDFRPGDRIIVYMTGTSRDVDTLTVNPARALAVPDGGVLSLDGVLNAELDERLTAQLARYFRSAVVRTQPLTRLAVLGEVRTPGFVDVPSQALLSDVITAAGGPTPAGRLDRVTVRRGGRALVSSAAFARGLAAGASIDGLGIRAGDEVVVGMKPSFNWTQLLQTTAILVGSAATFIAIQHR
jgi:protein involved in polysaccharide export with SLBB domain